MIKRTLASIILLSGIFASSDAEVPVNYEAELILNAGSGDFAPYYIASNRHGILTQTNNALLDLSVHKELDLSERFSYSFGVEALTGYSSKTDYLRYDDQSGQWIKNPQAPAPIFLQQLYGEVKFRGVFLSVGMKEREPALLNYQLSSGDFVESGNARPIPQVRAGFVDFQKVPLTNGWLEIQGELSYGKFADNDWMKNHYNYYNWHINQGALYTYKRLYLRSKSEMPFSVTVGMQTAGIFGGTSDFYRNGRLYKTEKYSRSPKAFFDMLIPSLSSGNSFVDGSALGSWDIQLRYRLKNSHLLKAYLQKPWEDGSGIGWMNGFDGIWGVEYQSADEGAIVSGAVAEYIDFTNQSGSIHWAPYDSPGTTITSHATGGDQYYNNYQLNGYMNYGLSIGTPFIPSPLYNLDGYIAYVNNRVRGFHLGVTGTIGNVRYRLLGGYRKAWGDSRIYVTKASEDTSMMLEASYNVARVPGLGLKAQIAFDAGSLYGDNFGACVTVSYNGLFKIAKK